MSPSISPPPAVKRSKVTYGRRKDSNTGGHAPDADSGLPSHTASLFAARKARLAQQEDDEAQDSDGHEFPETSMLTAAGNDSGEAEDDDDDDDGDKRPFQFDFKKHLAEIDQREDDELEPVAGANDGQDDRDNRDAMNVDKDGSPSTHHAGDIPTSPAAEPLPGHDDLFCGTLSSLTQSSLTLTSPEAAPVKRTSRAHARQVIHDSSDEEPAPPAEASSPRTSPQNPLGSPKDRTSTPPTTDDEMLPTRLTTKGKGKERVRSVATSLFDEEEEEVSRASTSRKGSKAADGRKGKGKEKAKKDKRPTKKEISESKRESARLIADKRTSIKSSTVTKPMSEFITHIKKIAQAKPHPAPRVGISSDPIQQFSSPSTHPQTHTPAPPSPVAVHFAALAAPMIISPFRPTGLLGTIPDATSDDDEEVMPSMRDILKRDQAKRELLQRKQLALERRAVLAQGDDNDSDLEIVTADVQEEAQDRKGRPRQSEGQKRQLEFGLGRSAARAVSASPEKQRTKKMGVDALKSAGRSAFSVANEVKKRGALKAALKKAELDSILLDGIEKQRAEEVRKKEEDYVKRGGRIKEGILEEKDVGEWLEKGLKVAAKMEGGIEEDSDEDGDWVPDEQERGSASPVPEEMQVEDDEDEGQTMRVDEEDAEADNGPEDDEENPFAPPRPRNRRRSTMRPRTVLDSDAESEGENPILPFSPTVAARQAPNASASVPTTDAENENENETDKENVENRMFDRGEDKENKAVVRHALGERPAPPLRQGSSLFGLTEGVQQRLSMSPSGANDGVRRPLGELPDEADDPFAFTPAKPTSGDAQSVLTRLRSPLPPSPTPAFGVRAKGKGKAGGFSQFFDEEGGAEQNGEMPPPAKVQGGFSQFFGEDDGDAGNKDAVPQPAALRGGFSQLFESGTATAATQGPKPMQLGGLTQAFEETQQNKSGFDSLRKNDLSLTFKTQLQPALDVDESLRQKAEHIFEKEQEYLVEAANRPAKQPQQKRELYVNENGFLTQTRPDVDSPELYRPSPSQHPNFFKTQRTQRSAAGPTQTQTQAQRQPLGTLAFSDDTETPSQRPMQRLRRREERDGYGSSPSPSPSPSRARQRNAYDALMRGASKDKGKEREKLGRSEFVDADAVESDEDDAFGFGGVRKRPGQEEDEEGDGDGEDDPTLEGLVDDAPMTDAAVAEALVREKVKEHQEADDAALEKQAKDVAEGRYRVKRRDRGVGLDDSESEDDDDEARRVRRAGKRRRIDGDKLEDLAKDAATRAFYEAYQVGHADDSAEFAHLNQDTAMADADADEEEDAEDGAGREIAASTVREKLRELARDAKEHVPMDPTDVSWLERDDEEDALGSLKFREIEGGARRLTRRGPGHAESDEILRRGQQLSASDRARMASWLKEESSSRIAGPGRGGAGASVTGLGRAKKTAGSGAAGGARGVAREAGAPAGRKLGKAASALAVVAERRGKFGN